MPLTLVNPIVGPEVVAIKISRIMNDTINARMNISYRKLDKDNNEIGQGSFKIKGIDDIRSAYSSIEDLIKSGETFEVASAKVLYEIAAASFTS